MKSFGETIRDLRLAQNLGLRESATKLNISPAYLSRIERGKEHPPRPEIIKSLAELLAADPDVLFRMASSTDPVVVGLIHKHPQITDLLRFLCEAEFTEKELDMLIFQAKAIKSQGSQTL